MSGLKQNLMTGATHRPIVMVNESPSEKARRLLDSALTWAKQSRENAAKGLPSTAMFCSTMAMQCLKEAGFDPEEYAQFKGLIPEHHLVEASGLDGQSPLVKP